MKITESIKACAIKLKETLQKPVVARNLAVAAVALAAIALITGILAAGVYVSPALVIGVLPAVAVWCFVTEKVYDAFEKKIA